MRQVVNDIVEQQLLLTHTAFLGRVTAVSGSRASVLPLTYAKDVHGQAKEQPLVPDAPRLAGVHVEVGDTVLCVVCERDISHAMRGQLSMPALRHHSLSDSVIVGVVEV